MNSFLLDSLTVYYHNFDYKQIDLSVGKDNVLSSINDNDNVEIIDNPKLELPKVEKKPKNRVIKWSIHRTPGRISREDCNSERYMHPSLHISTIYNSQDMEAT